MAKPDELADLLSRAVLGRARPSPSAHFRRACGALRSLPLADGWCRVVVALPGAHHHLDVELAEFRRASDWWRDMAARDRACASLAPLLMRRDVGMDRLVRLDDDRVRALLGYFDPVDMSRAPRPWNTAGLDVSAVEGEASVRQVFCLEPWPPVAFAAFRRRPGR